MTYSKNIISKVLSFVSLFVISILGLIFALNFIDNLLFDNSKALILLAKILVFLLVITSFILRILFKDSKFCFVNKIAVTFLILLTFFSFFGCLTLKSGLIAKFKSVNDIRDYVSKRGSGAVLTFILIQFSQVVVLPIPGVVTTGAGVVLFGPLYGAIYSFIGILIGSIVAFIIGKFLGYPVVKWLIGEQNLNKCLKLLDGKGKLIFFSLFLIPFFPDDMLCFAIGVSGINFITFLLVIFLARLITVFFSSFTLANVLIPFNTWWGIIIWIFLIFICIMALFYFIKKYKKKSL